MSDLLAPLLVIMQDEAQSYIVFCALMRRLKVNFLSDGKSMTKKFNHLSEGILFYDPEFFAYLKLHGADDLLFCYRWLLLELKREFSFEDACRVLEVLWSSLPPSSPESSLPLFEIKFQDASVPSVKKIAETPYARVAALRKRTGSSDSSQPKNDSEERRPRIQSDGSLDDRLLKYDLVRKSVSADKVKRVVKDFHEFYRLAKGSSSDETTTSEEGATFLRHVSTSEEQQKKTSDENEEATELSWVDPFDPNVVGYSQANGTNLSIVCKRLPPPTDFGDGNPFLMFLCISILIQHRGHILSHKFDYQEIAMYFDRLIRRHDVDKTLHIARKLFAEYLNEDWSSEKGSRGAQSNAC
ncbi:TBC1 domain family member 25like [Caligus rogercresseyi]|uniref:TBC1 domain family member 25like n=1 Tax=Caligus rogercresseyi TaxID=217165 RepID=A0A7T8HL96_CALRO|nr:TBC1 domain family member 25like [Caligus rogercresseyi]